MKCRETGCGVLVGLFCLSLLLLGLGAAIKGPFVSVDTGKLLSAGDYFLDALLLGNVSLVEGRESTIFRHYLISTVLLSGIHRFLGLGVWGVIAFNSVLFSLVVCAVFSVWMSICDAWRYSLRGAGPVVGVAAGMYIIFGLPDGFLWSYAILTDIIFLFWVAVFVCCTCRGLVAGGRGVWWLAFVAAFTAPFVRPTGLLLPLLFVIALGLHLGSLGRRRMLVVFAASVTLPALVVLIVVPAIVIAAASPGGSVDPWVPDVVERLFRQSVYFFEHGIIISNRLEVEPPEVLTYADVIRTIGYRLAYYWVPVRMDANPYSGIHNLVNIVYMGITVPLLAIGAKWLSGESDRHRKILLFLFMTAYGFALLHGITLVSFDWRYQLPAMVPYWIVAGCGFYACWRGR